MVAVGTDTPDSDGRFSPGVLTLHVQFGNLNLPTNELLTRRIHFQATQLLVNTSMEYGNLIWVLDVPAQPHIV